MERDLGRKPKFEINSDSGALVTALNRAVEAKQRGGEEHVSAIQELARLAANNPNAIEVLAAAQES